MFSYLVGQTNINIIFFPVYLFLIAALISEEQPNRPAMKRIVLLLFVICTACGRDYNGMDISHHNAVNWDAVKSDGNLEFCYIKSTEGSTLTDRRCRAHLRKAKDAGLKACGIRRGILPRANQRSTGALVAAAPPPCSNPCHQRKSTPTGCFFFGDPYGIRTHVTAVKGRCLNPLTNGPGSGNLTRTDDTPGMNRMLYQLSYAAMCFNSKIDYTR